MAETYAQLRVNGFRGIITGVRLPLGPNYVSISQLGAEGTAIGAIVVGGQRFTVSLMGGPKTWRPERLPPKQVVQPAPNAMVLDGAVVTGGYSVRIGPGKSLSTIAGEQYGDERLWPLIWDLNRDKVGDNPNRVRPDLLLTLLPRSVYSPSQIAEAHKRSANWKNYPH